jgi:hypothetical protein
LGSGAIELEIGIGRPVGAIAPIEEQRGPEAGPLDPLQELLRDDLIGVDVRSGERNRAAGVRNKGLHTLLDKYASIVGSNLLHDFRSPT